MTLITVISEITSADGLEQLSHKIIKNTSYNNNILCYSCKWYRIFRNDIHWQPTMCNRKKTGLFLFDVNWGHYPCCYANGNMTFHWNVLSFNNCVFRIIGQICHQSCCLCPWEKKKCIMDEQFRLILVHHTIYSKLQNIKIYSQSQE